MEFLFGDPDGILLSGYRTVHRTVLPNSSLPLVAEFGGRFESLTDYKTKTPPSKEDGVFIW